MLSNRFHLNTEKKLENNGANTINHFWDKNTQPGYFLGVDNKKIYTISIKTGNNNAIVISQGRNESTLKYKELAFDLNQQGYDVYLFDHRGQGLSERLGGDNNRAHVDHFKDYVTDLNTFVISLNLTNHYQYRFLLSHSMGGTISALYLQQYNHPFHAGIYFSPMFSINLGMPRLVAKTITYICSSIGSLMYKKPCYIYQGHGYQQKGFANNPLTSSLLRFNLSNNLFNDSPEIRLGSPTMRWASESISAAQKAIKLARKITIPSLIISSGADTIVTQDGQNKFFQNLRFYPYNQLTQIPNARHEILLERDQYRIPALNKVLVFLQQIKNNDKPTATTRCRA